MKRSKLSVLFASLAVVGFASFASAQTEAPAQAKKQATKVIDDAKKKVDDTAKKDPMEAKKEAVKQQAEDAKKQAEKKLEDAKKKAAGAAVKVGADAPAFELKDTDGNVVKLADLSKDGNIVVLEWFNPGCPFVVKHHEKLTTFKDLTKKYEGKKVKFVAINSGGKGMEGNGLELNKKAKKDFAMSYPVLLDESGEVGHAYGAQRTPHMFVIKDNKIAYMGAIDDNASPEEAGKVNYVEKAVDALLAGTSVETTETKPYGCGVKYGKK